MCHNTLLPVTQKACVRNFPPLSVNDTMNNMYYGKCKSYSTSEIIWENVHDRGVSDTGFHKSKYYWKMFNEVLKSRSR